MVVNELYNAIQKKLHFVLREGYPLKVIGINNKRPSKTADIDLRLQTNLILALEGDACYLVADDNDKEKEITLHKGEIMYVEENCWIKKISNSSNFKSITFIFHVAKINFILEGFTDTDYNGMHGLSTVWEFGRSQIIHKLLKQINSLIFPQYQDLIAISCAKIILYKILEAFVDFFKQKRYTKRYRMRMVWDDISSYIAENIGKTLTRASVGEALDLPSHQVNQLCKIFSGTQFKGYLIRIRLETSRNMLLFNDYKIEVIAERCGFSTASHFIYTFKKYFDISPKQLKLAQDKFQDLSIEQLKEYHKTKGFSILEPILTDEPTRKNLNYSEVYKKYNILNPTIFINIGYEPIDLYFIDNNGSRIHYNSIAPNQRALRYSLPGFVWILTNTEGDILAAYKTTEVCGLAFAHTNRP